MSSQNDNVDDFWGGQRDWTDSHPRQRNTGRTRLTARLKTGVQSVFDAGSSASRTHGDTGSTPVAGPVSPIAGDLDFDLTPARNPVHRSGDGLSIGELAQPYEPNVHEATQPVPRVSVGVVTPPANHSLDAAGPQVVGEPEPSPSDDYSGLAVDTDPWDEDWDAVGPVETGRGAVDPLLARVGLIAVVLTLLAGFYVSTRDSGSEGTVSNSETATTLGADAPGNVEQQAQGGSKKAKRQSDGGSAAGGGATAADMVADDTQQPAEQAAPAASQAPEVECAADYEVVEGDYWLRLADGSGVSLDKLLSANGASTDTPLYPGSTICLPAGAATPPPPPAPSTAAPARESAAASDTGGSSSGRRSSNSGSTATKTPAATTPVATSPPTTKAPATTKPPTTKPPTTKAPATTAAPASASEVERIIREIFPADQHEKALAVAWRESNHKPDVYNGWCCYGLFQMYYSVHQDWLRDFGVNQASDLYDARTNTIVAYELYQRSGGWGPWGG